MVNIKMVKIKNLIQFVKQNWKGALIAIGIVVLLMFLIRNGCDWGSGCNSSISKYGFNIVLLWAAIGGFTSIMLGDLGDIFFVLYAVATILLIAYTGAFIQSKLKKR